MSELNLYGTTWLNNILNEEEDSTPQKEIELEEDSNFDIHVGDIIKSLNIDPEKKEESGEKKEDPKEESKVEDKYKEMKNRIFLSYIKTTSENPSIFIFELNPSYVVGFGSINELDLEAYNKYLETQLSTGDPRVKTEYYPNGSKVEIPYFFNSDYDRAVVRAKLALYLRKINKTILPNKFLDRIAFIKTLNPNIIDKIITNGLDIFLTLSKEVEDNFENFSVTPIYS